MESSTKWSWDSQLESTETQAAFPDKIILIIIFFSDFQIVKRDGEISWIYVLDWKVLN